MNEKATTIGSRGVPSIEYRKKKFEQMKREYGRDAYGNARQAILKADVEFGYWRTYLQALVELMAIHGLTMEPRAFVDEGDDA